MNIFALRRWIAVTRLKLCGGTSFLPLFSLDNLSQGNYHVLIAPQRQTDRRLCTSAQQRQRSGCRWVYYYRQKYFFFLYIVLHNANTHRNEQCESYPDSTEKIRYTFILRCIFRLFCLFRMSRTKKKIMMNSEGCASYNQYGK